MQFSFTEVIMLGMFLLALLTYLKKRNNPPRFTPGERVIFGFTRRFPIQDVVQGSRMASGSLFLFCMIARGNYTCN